MAETKGKKTKADESDGFSATERAAMKERASELRASKTKKGKDQEPEVLAKIAELSGDEKASAEAIHELVAKHAPELKPKLWYGMPAYARDGKVLCFFQAASKFDTRYSTLGFNDIAALDDGNVWPSAYAITKLTAADKKKLGELIAKAAG